MQSADAAVRAELERTGTVDPAEGPTALVWRCCVAWAVGVLPTVLRLASHGPDGVKAAAVLAAAGALLLGARRTPGLSARDRWLVGLLVLGLAVALTVPLVGRAPVLLVVAMLLVADAAMSGAPRSRRSDVAPAVLALCVLMGAGALWWRSGDSTTSAALTLVGAALVLLSDRTALGRLDLRCADAALRVVRTVPGSGVSRTGATARRLLSTSAEGARAACRRVGSWVGLALAPRHRPILWSSLFVAMITAPIFYRLITPPFERVRGTNDIPGTIDRVRWMELWPPRIPVPHPGWSLAVKVTEPVLGEPWAVTVLLAVATGASTAVLITIARGMWDDRPPLVWSLACAMGIGYVVMENPAVFAPRSEALWSRYLEANWHARGQGYMPLHQWGTPTITLSMPFVFTMFALVLRVVLDVEQDSPRLVVHRRVLAVLTVVTTLVQPATTLALAPALPLYLIVTRRLDRRMARAISWFVVPGVLVCLGQTAFLATKVSPWEQATWLWRPFWSITHFGIDRPAYWTTALFFLLCAWAGGRRYVADPAVGLSMATFVVGVVPFVMLEQTGIYGVPDGDLGVPPLMAVILWFVSSLRFVLLELQGLPERLHAGHTIPLWAPLVVVMLVVMVAAGSVDLLMSSGVVPQT